MPAHQTRTIVVVTGEDETYAPLRDRAADLATEPGDAVILYDLDAASVFASPVPTEWSAEGEQDLVAEEARGDRLDPDALETAGRAPIAAQVRDLRARGIDAWAWLPTSRDPADLVAYAGRQAAEILVVPPGLEIPSDATVAVERVPVED